MNGLNIQVLQLVRGGVKIPFQTLTGSQGMNEVGVIFVQFICFQ